MATAAFAVSLGSPGLNIYDTKHKEQAHSGGTSRLEMHGRRARLRRGRGATETVEDKREQVSCSEQCTEKY